MLAVFINQPADVVGDCLPQAVLRTMPSGPKESQTQTGCERGSYMTLRPSSARLPTGPEDSQDTLLFRA